MDPFIGTIGFFIGLGTIIFLLVYFKDDKVNRRKIKKVPLGSLKDARDGSVIRIIGKVVKYENELTSPLSEKRCVGYHLHIQERRRKDEKNYFQTFLEQEVMHDFIVEDQHSKALIRVKDAKNPISKDQGGRTGSMFDRLSPAIKKLLEENGEWSVNRWGEERSLYITEGVLEIGEEVTVLGTGKWIPDESSSYGDQLFEMRTTEAQTVYFSDHPSVLKR